MFFNERVSAYEKILEKNLRLLLKDIKVLCHLQSEKISVLALQN